MNLVKINENMKKLMGGENQSGCFKMVNSELMTRSLLKIEKEQSEYTIKNRDISNWIFVKTTKLPIILGQFELNLQYEGDYTTDCSFRSVQFQLTDAGWDSNYLQ